MSTLYDITFEPRTAERRWIATVYAVETDGMVGFLCPETGKIVIPSIPAVREALPHYARAAFDRAGGRFWFPSSPGEPRKHTVASLTLRGTRGQLVGRVYARLYTMNLDRAPSAQEAAEIGDALA